MKNQDTTSLIGSLSDQYGGDTSNLYSQLEMHSREEKINQIILLQVGGLLTSVESYEHCVTSNKKLSSSLYLLKSYNTITQFRGL